MALMQWEALSDLQEFVDRSARLFPWGRSRTPFLMAGMDLNPSVDIAETETAYVITADVPGMAKQDLRVSIDDGVLVIEGERHGEHRQDGARMHRIERFEGSFVRRFTLPGDVDGSNLKAICRDGQLTVTVPKAGENAAAQAIQIPVD